MSRAALVTGGTRGIGRGISEALKEAGYTVAANYAGNDEAAVQFTEETSIHGFAKALAQEGARYNLAVNAIAPGYVDTDMVAAVPDNVPEKIVAKIPVGRLGHADEIARAVMFPIADSATFVTSSTMSINGGQQMY